MLALLAPGLRMGGGVPPVRGPATVELAASYQPGAEQAASCRSGTELAASYQPGADRAASCQPGAELAASYQPGAEQARPHQ